MCWLGSATHSPCSACVARRCGAALSACQRVSAIQFSVPSAPRARSVYRFFYFHRNISLCAVRCPLYVRGTPLALYFVSASAPASDRDHHRRLLPLTHGNRPFHRIRCAFAFPSPLRVRARTVHATESSARPTHSPSFPLFSIPFLPRALRFDRRRSRYRVSASLTRISLSHTLFHTLITHIPPSLHTAHSQHTHSAAGVCTSNFCAPL